MKLATGNRFERISLRVVGIFCLLVIFLMFSLLSTVSIHTATAKSARIALVEKVNGNVTVKKAGGSKAFKAYAAMTLNQGDHLTTDEGSSVILKIVDHDDEVTIGANSSVYLSKLSGDKNSKKTGMKMWAGSMWVKAKSLVNSEDEFEVETPTATMGVRGTQFFTGVDVLTGDTKVVVMAGVVTADITDIPGGDQDTETITLLPSQEANISVDEDSSEITTEVSILDVAEFVKTANPEVIEAIVRNKQASDKENEEFIAKKTKELEEETNDDEDGTTLDVSSLEALERVSKNLENLVGNIVNRAVETNRVDEKKIAQVIEKINKVLDRKLDLAKVEELELSEDEKKKQEEVVKQLNKRKKDVEEKRQEVEEENSTKYADLLRRIEIVLEKAQEANQEAIEKAQATARNGSKDDSGSTENEDRNKGNSSGSGSGSDKKVDDSKDKKR